MSNDAVLNQRFILTQVADITLMFPSRLVAETLLVERTKILPLPFYNSAILGCIHSGGQILTLVAPSSIFDCKFNLMRDVLTVVRLGEAAEHLANIGILVDVMLGSQTGMKESPLTTSHEEVNTKLFDITNLDKTIFQPQRWYLDKAISR
jgi:chemotaxis signal transduction protein